MTTELAVVEDGEVVETAAPITLFGTHNPVEVVDRASTIATALADVIKRRNLYKHIGQSDHVFVEGWTLLGSMLGVFAEIEWSRPLDDNRGWESRAVARTLAGRTVGAAESMCSRSESKWRNADDYAIRSMAQTRAVSKALRLPLGFIMELAGYSATPAEELSERPPRRSNEPAEPEGAEASAEAPASAPTSPQDGPPDMPDPSAAPDIGARYAWADRLGWDAIRLDEAAVGATEQTVMEMDREQWQAFAVVIRAGALDPPAKPGTDGYKRLLAVDKAKARAYWQSKEAAKP